MGTSHSVFLALKLCFFDYFWQSLLDNQKDQLLWFLGRYCESYLARLNGNRRSFDFWWSLIQLRFTICYANFKCFLSVVKSGRTLTYLMMVSLGIFSNKIPIWSTSAFSQTTSRLSSSRLFLHVQGVLTRSLGQSSFRFWHFPMAKTHKIKYRTCKNVSCRLTDRAIMSQVLWRISRDRFEVDFLFVLRRRFAPNRGDHRSAKKINWIAGPRQSRVAETI